MTSNSGAVQHSFDTDLFGTVRGQLGLTYNNWLFYGTGGFVWGNTEVARNQLITGRRGRVGVRLDQWRAGWTAGGGIEWGTPNWTARVEYL
jgi:opacity protein-like surface antigen